MHTILRIALLALVALPILGCGNIAGEGVVDGRRGGLGRMSLTGQASMKRPIHLYRALESTDMFVRRRAIEELAASGKVDDRYCRALIRAISKPIDAESMDAMIALADAGKRAIPHVLEALRKEPKNRAREALLCIGNL